MQEIKRIKTSVSQQDSIVNFRNSFGWKLQSSQEVNNIDNHLKSDYAGNVYQVREKEQYVILVFERDTGMPNYQEISMLESQAENLINQIKDEKIKPRFTFVKFLCMIIFPIIGTILVPTIMILKAIKINKENEKIKQQNSTLEQQIWDLQAKVRELV